MKVEVCFKAKTKNSPFPSIVTVCALPPYVYEWFTNEVLEVEEIHGEEEVSRVQLSNLVIAFSQWLTYMEHNAKISSDDNAAYQATYRILYHLAAYVKTDAFRFNYLSHEEVK